jgi:signal transduction histidine kinase
VNGAGGAGLGLSLSRHLARALDGDVRYAPERGAFIFEVPRG